MTPANTVIVDGREVPINGERNLLELCRNAGIDIPTFCYHSSLSVSGACRLCLVDIEGRGVVTSCSTVPEPGMRLRTVTGEIRAIRKMAVELLLADHDHNCPTCPKSAHCKLQNLARRLGVETVRFKRTRETQPIDTSSPAVTRNPNRCILCGDCVRACHEIQSVGAIDFAHRGSHTAVQPAFDADLNQVACVDCGTCTAVCPTGALSVAREIDAVWRDLDNPNKTVVVQFAPAVRVAIGEAFGLPAGSIETGRLVAALRRLGFNQVYDTCFAADLTVLEECAEFVKRVEHNGPLPLFTSCCPAWVRFAEFFAPDMLDKLSTCRSPQQMFGSVAKTILPDQLGIDQENLVVVSVMPCTAKKGEARREEFRRGTLADVDHVLTTGEISAMIEERGIDFNTLAPESLDMPFGFKSGAGLIFGASGGVSEAVLRHAAGTLGQSVGEDPVFLETRGEEGIRECHVEIAGKVLRLAIVNGLGNARRLLDDLRAGRRQVDLVEVMACPGGCVGGAGQPMCEHVSKRQARSRGLYDGDRMLQLHRSQDNHMVAQLYENLFGAPGGALAHRLLHTSYRNRKRSHIPVVTTNNDDTRLPVWVCIGTACHLRGGQRLLAEIDARIAAERLDDRVQVAATFCLEQCNEGPNVMVGDHIVNRATIDTVMQAIETTLAGQILDTVTS